MYLAGQDEVVSEELLRNQLQEMTAEGLCELMDKQEKFMANPRFAYSFAFSFVEHLYENYSEEPFQKIL